MKKKYKHRQWKKIRRRETREQKNRERREILEAQEHTSRYEEQTEPMDPTPIWPGNVMAVNPFIQSSTSNNVAETVATLIHASNSFIALANTIVTANQISLGQAVQSPSILFQNLVPQVSYPPTAFIPPNLFGLQTNQNFYLNR